MILNSRNTPRVAVAEGETRRSDGSRSGRGDVGLNVNEEQKEPNNKLMDMFECNMLAEEIYNPQNRDDDVR